MTHSGLSRSPIATLREVRPALIFADAGDIRLVDVTECPASEAASLRLDARDLYNLVPLRRLGSDVGFERGGAQHHRNRADIGEPCPDVRLRQSGIHLATKPLDDLRRCPS